MARIDFSDPIASMSGRFSDRDKVYMRTRYGRTHAYAVKRPYEGPRTEQQKTNSSSFGEVSKQVHAEMSDPVRRAYWEKEFAAYTKKYNPPSKRPESSNCIPVYNSRRPSTIKSLYGYIFHTLYTQLKQSEQSQQPEQSQQTPQSPQSDQSE